MQLQQVLIILNIKKMKKIISILAILLCFATSYAQETEPTKQETMDWIGKTLLKYKNINGCYFYPNDFKTTQKLYDFNYSNGLFLYKSVINEDGEETKTQIVINLDKIMAIQTDGVYGHFRIIGKNFMEIKYKEGTNSFIDDYSFTDRKCNAVKFIDENDIFNRFIKAMNTLIDYNKSELPKEKF